MYSFIPKLSQQLGQLAKMNKNPYINNQNPPFEPPEGPGNVYKNLLAGDKERFYRNYDNKWYVAGERDGQEWRDISPEGWNEMLNNMVKMNPAQNDEQYDNNEMGFDSRLYRQGNPEYKEISPITNASIPNQTAGLGMFNIPVTTNDMGGTGVLLSNNPFPKVNTPELDMLMGKAETPYTMDYVPFVSEEEMLRQTNPPPPDPLYPEPIKIQTLDATGINNLAKNMPLPGAIQQTTNDNLQNYEPINIPFLSYKDTSGLAKDMPLPSGLEPEAAKRQTISNTMDILRNRMPNIVPDFNKTNTEKTNPQQNKFGLAEGYYLGNSLLNASAAINNMVQPEPPSIQMKLPHFERQRLNPEQYDAMRSQIGEQSNAAYRLQRENISQASDLMKGLAAVTSGTQQAMMNVGLNQAGAEQQIQNINQQISMQEQGLQTDTLNKEAITNWQIQDEFYKTKGQAISSALAALSQTGGQFAKYKTMQEMINKQDAINKSAAEINNEMQASLLQYELSESALSSQEYQDYYKSQRTAEQERINKELLGDEKYKAFNDYYNGVIPSYSSYQYNIDSPESQEKLRTINVAKRFQSEYPLGAAPDITKFPNDKEGYDKAVAEYNKYKAYNDRYNNDPRYKAYEAEQAFWKEALEKFNESALKKSTAETYLKSRNLPTQTEILQRLKAISERGAQSFE